MPLIMLIGHRLLSNKFWQMLDSVGSLLILEKRWLSAAEKEDIQSPELRALS